MRPGRPAPGGLVVTEHPVWSPRTMELAAGVLRSRLGREPTDREVLRLLEGTMRPLAQVLIDAARERQADEVPSAP